MLDWVNAHAFVGLRLAGAVARSQRRRLSIFVKAFVRLARKSGLKR